MQMNKPLAGLRNKAARVSGERDNVPMDGDLVKLVIG